MTALVYDIAAPRWIACKLIGRRRPGVFWSRLGGLSLRQVPVPSLPGDDWVRLRPILGGICGTDMAAIMQRQHPAHILQIFSSLPALLGHENVSIVESVGSQVSRVQVGDRVVVEPTLSCVPRGIEPVCRSCAAGQFTLCENFRTGPLSPGSMIGWNSFTGGSWSEYFVAHESQLYKVPDAIDDTQAVLVDPIAGALHAALRYRPSEQDRVLILGAGPLGMGVAMALRAVGVRSRITTVVWTPQQGEMMQRMGVDEYVRVGSRDNQAARYGAVAATIGGKVYPSKFGHCTMVGGYDVVYDCVGTNQTLSDAMKYVRPRGTVVEVGTSQIGIVDTCPLWFSELNLIGANGRAFEQYEGRTMHTYEIVFDLIQRKKLDLTSLLTHRFRVSEYKQAFATLFDRGRTGAIKVAFEHR